MKILIAPNAFKNSITASEAAIVIKEGLSTSVLKASYECFPIADGGDGTAALIMQKCQGEIVEVTVSDPLEREIASSFGLINGGKTAIIEMADASGLRLLKPDEQDPTLATSKGTGQLLKMALDKGVEEIFLGMGGSATVDGGLGILKALGVKFLDSEGNSIENVLQSYNSLSSIDLSKVDQRVFNCQLTVLCDVDSKLLGEDGAAAVFGPQKGASPEQVKELDAFLTQFNHITLQQTGLDMSQMKYGGTAGGAAAAVAAYFNARLENGISYFLKLTRFEDTLKACDFLITGEGALDHQTLQGKGPVGVAKVAKERGIPVFALTGKVALSDIPQLRKYFDVILPIGNQPMGLDDALKSTHDNLKRTAAELGYMLKLVKSQ
ncbi:glycerate kinase [Desertivirga xinjiangensis]|uniref:glycerate kinase n=1 Tax=Desertivirga xinjiangensis TaxID=539206 RepID=UPI00210BE5DB|nr:glycerate kinase [Pedobacter xinjiangensis]